MPFGRHLKRALARRFPRTRRAYNRLRAYRPRLPLPRLWRVRATARWLRATLATLAARRRDARLTVAVDVTAFWEPLTGIGWYLYRLLEHLADFPGLSVRLYGPTVVDSPDLAPPVVPLPAGPALETVTYRVPEDLVVPPGLLIPLLRRLEPLLIAADGSQVLFAPNYFLPRRFLLAGGARVATIHDLGVRQVPWTLRPETLRDLTDRLEHALFEAARLITVSGAIRDELAAFGYSRPERVRVVHHGPGQLAAVEPTAKPPGTPARYALHVGTLEPRKNILHLLAAWRALRRRLDDRPVLVLCGRYGWKTEAIRREVAAAQAEGWVRHLGYVAEGELAALYRDAEVVLLPSLYEGFGLPALEALAAGAPLVCSDLPVLHEVAGGAALYASPDEPEELADRVAGLLADPELARELRERGRHRAAEFSWQRAARRTAAVWFEAAGEPPPQ